MSSQNYNSQDRKFLEEKYKETLDKWKKCMYKMDNWEKLTKTEIEYLCNEASLINQEIKLFKEQFKNTPSDILDADSRYDKLMDKFKEVHTKNGIYYNK